MPAYNAERTIVRTLDSIAGQTVKPKEVIIVDDGSTDKTAENAETMRPRMNGVDLIIIRQEHKGAGAARNRALQEAGSDYVAFLDADDEWLPEKLETFPYPAASAGSPERRSRCVPGQMRWRTSQSRSSGSKSPYP